MAFHTVNPDFNSSSSANLLKLYETFLDEEISESSMHPKNRSFAPSQFRCARASWFRLRGTNPSVITRPDRKLKFDSEIGTACHEMIQKRLSSKLGDNWVDVEAYVKEQGIECKIERAGYEVQIEITHPYPIRFACDGIVIINGQIFLLEIKTCDHSSFVDLVNPKDIHIDQVKFYCKLLKLFKVLFLYVDRQYGDMKCFEYTVSESAKIEIEEKLKYITDMVAANIAPEGLPKGDNACTSNMCPYYKVCQEWGR